MLRINAAISALAVVAIGLTAFGADAGATLAAFGTWAAVSGAIQLGVAVHRRRTEGRQLPLIVSGALSTIAGLVLRRVLGWRTPTSPASAATWRWARVLFLLSAHGRRTAR